MKFDMHKIPDIVDPASTSPKQAFSLMLLERIEALEQIVADLTAKLSPAPIKFSTEAQRGCLTSSRHKRQSTMPNTSQRRQSLLRTTLPAEVLGRLPNYSYNDMCLVMQTDHQYSGPASQYSWIVRAAKRVLEALPPMMEQSLVSWTTLCLGASGSDVDFAGIYCLSVRQNMGMTRGSHAAAGQIRVWRCTSAHAVSEVTSEVRPLSSSDTAWTTLTTIQESLGMPAAPYVWARTPMVDMDASRRRIIAEQICKAAQDPKRRGIIRTMLLKDVLHACLEPAKIVEPVKLEVLTWDAALDIVESSIDQQTALLSRVGFAASMVMPLDPFSISGIRPEEDPQILPEPELNMTLERFGFDVPCQGQLETSPQSCTSTEVHLYVATLDDVRRHLTMLGDSAVLRFYFPDAYDTSILREVAPELKRSLDGEVDIDEGRGADKDELAMMMVRSMHMELLSYASLGNSLGTAVSPVDMQDAFFRIPLSSGVIDAVRMLQPSTRGRFRIVRDLFQRVDQGASVDHADLLRRLNSVPLVDVHVEQQLACFCKRSSPTSTTDTSTAATSPAKTWWALVVSRTVTGGLYVNIHMLSGAVSLSDMETELLSVKETMVRPIIDLLVKDSTSLQQNGLKGLPGLPGLPWFDPWRIGMPHRLHNIVINTALHSDHARPTVSSIADMLASSAEVNNVHTDGPSIMFQYCKVDGYVPLTAAQQAVRLNTAMPIPVLLGMLQGRFGMEQQEARHLITSELSGNRRFEQRPLFVIARITSPGTVRISLNGPINSGILRRIRTLLTRSLLGPMSHNQSTTTKVSDDGQESHDMKVNTVDVYPDDADDGPPIELANMLSGLEMSPVEDESPDPSVEDVNKDGSPGPSVEDVNGDAPPGRYIINDLHRGDAPLFDTGSHGRKYSRICGHVVLRQPVRMSPEEIARNEAAYPGALTGSVATGSSQKAMAANRYICPKVWCPRSRTALTMEQYDALGKQCPNPDIQEDALIFDDDTYWQGRPRYPGLLNPKFHPDGLCMPCCFLKPNRGTGNKSCRQLKSREPIKESQQDVDVEDDVENTRYIYNSRTMLPNGRYGFLPRLLHDRLNQGATCATSGTSHLTKRMTCVLRKGIASGASNVYACLAQALGISGDNVPLLVRLNLEPETFLALHSGHLALSFMVQDPLVALTDAAMVKRFAAWLQTPAGVLYVSRAGLQEVQTVVSSGGLETLSLTTLKSMTSRATLHAIREYMLFHAMQQYLAALERSRSHTLIIDLVNMGLSWLNPHGIHVVVLVTSLQQQDEILLSLPVLSGSRDSPRHHLSMLIQTGGQYEIVCGVSGTKAGILEQFAFDVERLPASRDIVSAIQDLEFKSTWSLPTFLHGIRAAGKTPSHQVMDYSLRCVAIVVHPGLLVPLPHPHALHLERNLNMVFVDSLRDVLVTDNLVTDNLVHDAESFFGRLSSILQDPRYAVVRAIDLSGGGKGLLLAMGKVSPMSGAAHYLERMTSQLDAFLNVDMDDDRVLAMGRIDKADAAIEKTLLALYSAIKKDAIAMTNLEEMTSSACSLPWDVCHRYLTWMIMDRVPDTERMMASRVADRILLGIRQRGWESALPRANVLMLAVSKGHELETRDLQRSVVDVNVDNDRVEDDQGEDRVEEDHLMERVRAVQSSTQMRSTRHSRLSRRERRGHRSPKMEIMAIPLTMDLVFDVVLHAIRILRPASGIRMSHLRTLPAAQDYQNSPLQLLLALTRSFDIPVTNFNPDAMEINIQKGISPEEPSILVQISGTEEEESFLLLTRQHKNEIYGTIVRPMDLTAPALEVQLFR